MPSGRVGRHIRKRPQRTRRSSASLRREPRAPAPLRSGRRRQPRGARAPLAPTDHEAVPQTRAPAARPGPFRNTTPRRGRSGPGTPGGGPGAPGGRPGRCPPGGLGNAGQSLRLADIAEGQFFLFLAEDAL